MKKKKANDTSEKQAVTNEPNYEIDNHTEKRIISSTVNRLFILIVIFQEQKELERCETSLSTFVVGNNIVF